MSSAAVQAPPELFDPEELYLVTSEEDSTVLLALDAKCHGDLVEWFDTYRDRAKPALAVEKQGAVITVKSEGATYRFEPLTKALYDARVKEQVELSPDFENTGDLKRFYLRSFLGKEEGE
jgi:hypothetical protein